jgi:L,D-transpeptidase catalytic domain
MRSGFSRRTVLKSAAAIAASLAAFEIIAVAAREVVNLKPGEFLWAPEKSPEGPVAIIVSIPDQLVHVYRSGVRIGLSTCSTGKKGHSTPTGVFTILQKDKNHHSSTYNDAPMPNMNRLTWSGVALHAGNLPGYPASHGCVRLPIQFSEYLFSVTHVGTPVVIADDHSEPTPVTHPGPILSSLAEHELKAAVAGLEKRTLPPQERHDGMQHAVSILVSRSDRELYVLKDGKILAKGRIDIVQPNEPFGSHVFVLTAPHKDGRSADWLAIRHTASGSPAGSDASADSLIGRVQSDPALAKQVADLMHPGLVLVMTDAPLDPQTRSTRDFVVMAQDTTGTNEQVQ